jgi:ABC-2 type transport system permease protein
VKPAVDRRAAIAPEPRRFGAVNWRGVWSLYRRNVHRFFRYGIESIGGPAVSSLLFLAVFDLALGGRGEMAPGASLAQFITPGIVIFSLAHSAFESAAAPIVYDKLDGMIGDVIGAPLTPLEVTAGYVLAAATDGLITGTVILGLMAVFVELPFHSLVAILGFAVAAALLFALIGVLTGLWADRWDNYSAAETFLILPLGLLSGAFFSLQGVPESVRWLFELNPVFHAVQGFRFGFIGATGGQVLASAIVLGALILALAGLAWRLFAIGYKIKC